jgi:aspartate aminotransferase
MMGVSQRMEQVLDLLGPVAHFFTESEYARRAEDPAICDFAVGNPQELPLPGFAEALGRWSVPQNNAWFAYKTNEPAPCAVVAAALRERRGLPFEADDIFLTNGAFAALAVILSAITDPGDEVLFLSPPWFFYEALIAAAGARPIRVKIDRATFDLDLDAIRAAISPRTRAIIVNSPHNPTGKIYSPAMLERLAGLLTEASSRIGHPIYLLSDEAYSRIVFDGRAYHSPTSFYPHSFLVYTYGKTLLTPGQRLGYIALPPTMPHREQMRSALFVSQMMTGYAFPNALLQHALADLEQLSIDVAHLQRKRDWLVERLRDVGYDLHIPEGTFYLLPRSPWADDRAFVDLLTEYDIFCLPGVVVELPGYFRISLTANDTMIERAIPGFAAAAQRGRSSPKYHAR